MAALNYRTGLDRYRRYLRVIGDRPLLQSSLFLVFSLVLLIVLVSTALRPTVVTIANLVGQIESQKDIERKLDNKIATLAQAQQNLQLLSNKLPLLDQALPTSPKMANWTQTVEKLAETSGVTILSFSLAQVPVAKTPGAQTAVQTFPFTLTLNGDLATLKTFLTALENTRRLATFETITLSNVVREGTEPQLQLVITGSLAVLF